MWNLKCIQSKRGWVQHVRLGTADSSTVILVLIAPVSKILSQLANCTCLLDFVSANSSVKEIIYLVEISFVRQDWCQRMNYKVNWVITFQTSCYVKAFVVFGCISPPHSSIPSVWKKSYLPVCLFTYIPSVWKKLLICLFTYIPSVWKKIINLFVCLHKSPVYEKSY